MNRWRKNPLSQSGFPLIIILLYVSIWGMLPHDTNTYTLDMAELITLRNKLDELLKLGLKFVLKLLLGSQCWPSAGTGVPLFLWCRCTLCAWCVSGVNAKMTEVRQMWLTVLFSPSLSSIPIKYFFSEQSVCVSFNLFWLHNNVSFW